jgi:hypothetical protein
MVALLTTVFTFCHVAADLGRFRHSDPGFQLEEGIDWLAADLLSHGRRRHFHAVRHPDHLPDAAVHPGQLEAVRSASRNT